MAVAVAVDPKPASGAGSLRGVVRRNGDIQSELAVFLPSAQTFINITSQSIEKPTSNLQRKKRQK